MTGTVILSDVYNNALSLVFAPLGSQVPVTPQPDILLTDNANGSIIDTVNRWQAPVLGGTGTLPQTGGSFVPTVGTTATNGAALTSIENFESSIGSVSCGTVIAIEANPGLNTSRVFGCYTRPGGYTAANPVQDGYVWELDITGNFGASIYSGGARIFRQIVPLLGSTFLPLLISYQGLSVAFFINDFKVPLIVVPVLQPSTLNLPVGFHLINHTVGPGSAPTWSLQGIVTWDQSGTLQNVFNGQAISRTRSPNKVININAVSIAAETTIWTPAAGRKFRLMGYVLESGTIGGNVLLKDNTAGATILIVPFGAANGVIASPPMGNGILSGAVNNVLTATGTATQTLSGYVFGTEE